MDYLGVVPGAVTAFGVINDKGGQVKAILDEELMSHDIVNGHPLVNTATTSIAPGDLVRFMRATGHDPAILKVGQ
jgi:Ala-tRNA(Pro) deacylase